MPFDKFVDSESLEKERWEAVHQSVRKITRDELTKIVTENLSDFEGDPWQANFLRVVEEHPEGSFYRAMTKEGVIVLYSRHADTGVWVLPHSGMGPLPDEGKRHVRKAIGLPVLSENPILRANQSVSERQSPKSKNKPVMRTLSILGALLLATLSSACSRKAPQAAPPAPEVLIIDAAIRDVPVHREWIGTIDGSENADIRARVTGHLIKRDYIEGSLVRKGDLLFEIDPRPFEAALAEAKGQLDEGKAAALAAAADRARHDKLFAEKVISAQEHTNKRQTDEATQAKVKALEAAVVDAELNLNFCKVIAPVDGIAGMAKAQVGDLVGNDVVLTSISTVDPAKISFPVSEADYFAANEHGQELLNMPLEQRPEEIEVILADGSTFPHKARLLAVDRQAQTATGTILVTALVKNPGGILRPGFFARARVVAQVLKDSVVAPQRAVNEVQGAYQLGIIGAENKVEIRPVKVGPRNATDWVITSGLKPGEKVVVEGLQKIKDGAVIVAKPWTPPADKSLAIAGQASGR
jgi:RND family efflux transporter MFP subunit